MRESQNNTGSVGYAMPQPVDALHYLSKYPDFVGRLSPTLSHAISRELSNSPVKYETPLDGITLLRGLLPANALPTHYALLLREQVIVGVAVLPAEDFDDMGLLEEDQVSAFNGRASSAGLNARELMRSIVQVDATRVMIGTSRRDKQHAFDQDELNEVLGIKAGLDLFSVELIEWILLYPDMNVSWAWALYGEEGMEEGVSIDVLEQQGVGLVDKLLAK